MHPEDSRLAKIRKLLAQAEDPAATPGEAAAFTAKATRLMADYGVDRALLAEQQPESAVVGDQVIEVQAPYAGEKATLGSVIASALRCRAVIRRRPRYAGTEQSLHVFGRPADLTLFEMLFTSLLLQGTSAMTAAPVPLGEQKAAFRRTWWLGFSGAIERRLREFETRAARAAEERFAAAGMSAALVLADQAAQAEDAMRTAYPRLRTAGPRRLSGSGSTAGWMSGQRADLGRGRGLDRGRRGEIA